MKTTAICAMCVLILAQAPGQISDADVQKYLFMIESGQADKVKEDLPTLLSRYPNNPGILYVQGMATTDGAEAVRIYQSIVDNFPRSDWADDALYKTYQFYYTLGLYRTAEIKLNQLKTNYPNSKYVAQSGESEAKIPAQEPPPAEQINAEPPTVEAPKGEAPAGQFTLQVGAYSTQVNAEKQKLFFEDLGHSVEVINKVKQNRSLYIVLVGNYATYDDAKAKGAEFKKKYNIDSIVVSR